MNELSVQSMPRLLTMPYRRGAEILSIPLGTDAGEWTNVSLYDFREYHARYQSDPPKPKYILFPKKDIGSDELEIEVKFSIGGGPEQPTPLKLKIPARAFAGASFAIPLPEIADATLRLQRFRQLPIPLPGTGAENWGIIALLGNIAKLTWVLGWEKDHIRQHLRDVHQQRRRTSAHSDSLDKLGEDLRVPRFPPREHSFDAYTIALYHLNDVVADNGEVADDTKRFGLTGHPGINKGAQSGATGKFGNGFRFPGPTGSGAIEIPTHADFDIFANGSFTVEAFVKADGIDNPSPQMVVSRGLQDASGALGSAGWSLTLGSFRGFSNNVRWEISDGTNKNEIFADVNVADGKFHHLAGILDRSSRRARLFVDGEERAGVDSGALGAVANGEKVRIGRSSSGNQFFGVIDEVRLSNVARPDFHPVLGEGDAAYRERLGIFERWLLPTPDNLLKAINSLVQINGQADSFVLIEKDRPGASASKAVRILPAALSVGQGIDREGNLHNKEREVSEAPEDDIDFKEIYLIRHDDTRVIYGANENNRRMQAVTKHRLDALLNLIAAATPSIAGKLIIDKSFDPADTGLPSVGRALLLHHQTLPVEQLGVYAHRAGFDFVRNDTSHIYASVAAGEKLEVVIEPRPVPETPPAGIDVFIGKAIDLHLAPESLPSSGQISWTLIPCGAGRVHFVKHPSDASTLRTQVTSRPRLRLVADAPGEITIRVEYTYQRRTVTGTRRIHISIQNLEDGKTIAANGDMRINEAEAVGKPGEVIDPIYLITHSDAGVNYGTDPNNKKMQIVLEKPLNRLLKMPGVAGGLQILKSYNPADTGLHKAGRALRLQHAALDAAKLGALAHQAGFGFVRRQGAEIYCSVAAGEKIEITQASDLKPLGDELTAGTPIDLRVRSADLPTEGNYNWSIDKIGQGRGSFDFVLRPRVKFTPREPGLLLLNVTYLKQDAQSTFPYTFEIRLKDSLNVPGTIIPKHQYDLIMNILNYFHPIGIEVVTRNIREHVVEVRENLLKAFPGYTYPDFRV